MADMGFMPAVTELLDQAPARRPADAVLRDPGPQRATAWSRGTSPTRRCTPSTRGRRGHHDGPPRVHVHAERQGRGRRRDRGPAGPHADLRAHQARRRPARQAAARAGVRPARCTAASRRAAPAHPGAFTGGHVPGAGGDQRRRPRHPRRRPRPGGQRGPAADHKDYLHRGGRTARAGSRRRRHPGAPGRAARWRGCTKRAGVSAKDPCG